VRPRRADAATAGRSTRALGSGQPLGFFVKVRDVIRLLEKDGWRHIRTTGSHRQYQHSVKPGTVTVAGKASLDVPIGTLNSILKQSGLKKGKG
jgi:predicted RNA binding protein YcfA (HicA-like mRNA interferase family)